MKAKPKLFPCWVDSQWVYAPFPGSLSLGDAKSSLLVTTNEQAYTYLFPSDWMSAKKVDTGEDLAPEWAQFRQSIRDESASKRAEIEKCATLDELRTYSMSDDYLTWSDAPGS